MRKGPSSGAQPSLESYLAARHMLVSAIGDAYGTVDAKLSEQGQSRRVVLTVPNFMMALVQLAEIDLVATLPRHLVARHAGRFNLTTCPVPLPWKPAPVRVLASKAAMADAGIAWLFETMERCMGVSLKARAAERRRARGIMGNI